MCDLRGLARWPTAAWRPCWCGFNCCVQQCALRGWRSRLKWLCIHGWVDFDRRALYIPNVQQQSGVTFFGRSAWIVCGDLDAELVQRTIFTYPGFDFRLIEHVERVRFLL